MGAATHSLAKHGRPINDAIGVGLLPSPEFLGDGVNLVPAFLDEGSSIITDFFDYGISEHGYYSAM